MGLSTETENGTVLPFSAISGSRKIIGLENVEKLQTRRPTDAYDLDQDPWELNNLSRVDAWPLEMFKSIAPEVETLLIPIVSPLAADLDAEKLEELRAMGYVGD